MEKLYFLIYVTSWRNRLMSMPIQRSKPASENRNAMMSEWIGLLLSRVIRQALGVLSYRRQTYTAARDCDR